MYCKNCAAPINPGQPNCANCGTPVGVGVNFCANCAAPVAPGSTVCTNCRSATTAPAAAPGYAPNGAAGYAPNGAPGYAPGYAPNPAPGFVPGAYLNGKDKITMALICFFIGYLGIHNFMLGEQKKGILKLVCFLVTCGSISGILALIDFIKILTDKYVVDPNALI